MRLRVVAIPSGSPRIVFLSNAGTTVGNLQLLPTGRLRLRNGSTTVGADSTPMTVGSTYLIGIHQKRGTGANAILEAFLAPDGGTFGTAFARTTTGTWTTAADRLRLGATNGTAINLTVDDVLIGSGSMPTPVASSSTMILAAAVPGSSYAMTAPASSAAAGGGTRRVLVVGPGYVFVCLI